MNGLRTLMGYVRGKRCYMLWFNGEFTRRGSSGVRPNGGGTFRGLEHAPVAFGAGLEFGDSAVGAALGAPGHGPGGGEAEVGLADAEGC